MHIGSAISLLYIRSFRSKFNSHKQIDCITNRTAKLHLRRQEVGSRSYWIGLNLIQWDLSTCYRPALNDGLGPPVVLDPGMIRVFCNSLMDM